ncbi:MAG: TIGR02444 family protein [Pseudomonadota bacterium]
MNSAQGNSFWQWSLAAYDLPGAKQRLVSLQDSFGFDVNIALWCCWRAREGETLSEDTLRKADAAVASWTEGVIEALRDARRNAKAGPPAIYEQIKDVELAAERRAQDLLFTISASGSSTTPDAVTAAATTNLLLYASLIDAPRREGFSSALLRDLIDHIFPQTQKSGAYE